ncbi:MAG: ferritin family protein [Fibrobacteres bacterium]|nr:ferritin family protein [Fibrobacterota bacterium]
MNNQLNQWVEFAIGEEEKAFTLYAGLAVKVTDKGAKEMLMDMANMEKGHAAKLRSFKAGESSALSSASAANLKMGEYMVEKPLSENATVQDVLLFAIQAEKKAVRLYNDMSSAVTDPSQKDFFVKMAEEEARHKNSLETAYDDNIFKEN